MFTIKSIIQHGIEIGFYVEEGESQYTLKRDSIRSKDIFESLPGKFSLHHGDRMLKQDGQDIPMIDISEISEDLKFGLYVDLDESSLLPIQSKDPGYTANGEKEIEIDRVDLGELNIKTREELEDFIKSTKADIDLRLYVNPNRYTSKEARFTIEEARDNTHKFNEYLKVFLTPDINQFRNQLKVLEKDGSITDESSPDEIMLAYFKSGYPLIAEAPIEVKLISGSDYAQYTTQSIDYTSQVKDVTFCLDSSLDITWIEDDLQSAKSLINTKNAHKTKIKTNVGEVGHRVIPLQEKLVLIRYEEFNIIVSTRFAQYIKRGSIQRTFETWNPQIAIGRSIPYDLMNILSDKVVKSLDSIILCEEVSKSMVNSLRLTKGYSSYEIMSNGPFSVTSILKYIFRLDNETTGDDESIVESKAEVKENKKKRYLKGIELIRELAPYLSITENGIEFLETVDELGVDDVLDVDNQDEISRDEIKSIIEDFVSGRKNIGSTGSTITKIKTGLRHDLYYFLRVALMYLDMEWEDIIPQLVKIASGNFQEVLKLSNSKGEIEINFDIDQNVIINKNMQDYVSYTSLSGVPSWLYVLDVYTTPNTLEHMAIRYLNLKTTDANNKLNPNFEEIAVAIQTALREVVSQRVNENSLMQQIAKNKEVEREFIFKFTAEFIFGIFTNRIPVEIRQYKYESGIEKKFAAVLNFFGTNKEIELYGLKLDYIRKNVTEHIDTLAAICETSVNVSGISKAFVNAKVKWNKVTPNKGYTINEFPIMAMYIPLSLGSSFRDALISKGYLTDPKTKKQITYSLLNVPPMFKDSVLPHYSPKNYVAKCHEYAKEHKGKQDVAYRCPPTPLQIEFPGIYPYKELDESPGNVTGLTKLSLPRIIVHDENQKTLESIKLLSSGTSENEMFLNYIPMDCYEINDFNDIKKFILNKGPVIKKILGNAAYNSMYEKVTTVEEAKSKGMAILKMKDGRYLLRTNTRYIVLELR